MTFIFEITRRVLQVPLRRRVIVLPAADMIEGGERLAPGMQCFALAARNAPAGLRGHNA